MNGNYNGTLKAGKAPTHPEGSHFEIRNLARELIMSLALTIRNNLL